MRKNYPAGTVRELYGGIAGGGGAHDSVDTYRDWYKSLPANDLAEIRCVASHTANLLMPTLGRPFRAFCLLRDPVERVWSIYHGLKLLGLSPRSGTAFESGREIVRRNWSLSDVYGALADGGPTDSQLHGQLRVFFNDQTRRILAPWRSTAALGYSPIAQDEDKCLLDNALEILDLHYTVGTKENYEASVAQFAATFGWRRLAAKRVDRSVPRGEMDEDTRVLILTHNRLDAELHANFSRPTEKSLSDPNR